MEDRQALELAVRAAREGGKVALERLGDPGYITWKGHRDVTSEASLRVQDAIISRLKAGWPDCEILAEEGPEDAPLPVDAEHLWIVDPICGSLNFVQGIPYFAVSIALRSRGDIRVGVVYDPCRDELFQATFDLPATLNGEPITVQQLSEGSEAYDQAHIGTDWPYSGQRRADALEIAAWMGAQVTHLTTMGSPALGLCNLAAGRLHAYWHLDLKIWDLAAASLILQRAGGILTDARGDSWLFSDGGYIATNSVIHGSVLRSLQQVYALRKNPPAPGRA